MNLRNRLREETKASHQMLDNEVGTLGVFESSAGYLVYLSCLYRLYSVYAKQIDWASDKAGIPRCVDRLKKGIVADCSHAEADWTPELEDRSGDQRTGDQSMSPSCCWAAAYVLEGSAMGARYMVKQCQSSPLVVSGEIQIGYLSCLADESHQRWPAFVEALEEADCDPDETVDAAKDVFKTAAKIFAEAINQHRQTSLER